MTSRLWEWRGLFTPDTGTTYGTRIVLIKPGSGASLVEPVGAGKYNNFIANCDIIHTYAAFCLEFGP